MILAPTPSALLTATLVGASAGGGEAQDLGGLVGLAARVIAALGEAGVGALILLETVFPPIPSEVILPLAGFLTSTGQLSLPWVIVAATIGSWAGAAILYAVARRIGHDRAVRLMARLPLVDAEDFEKASAWFSRHGDLSVLVGRLIPGVRSVVSLPAGAERMPFWRFTVFTLIGSAIWNGALVGLGAALGSQYELIEQYSGWLDAAVYTALGVALIVLVVRRIRRGRRDRRPTIPGG